MFSAHAQEIVASSSAEPAPSVSTTQIKPVETQTETQNATTDIVVLGRGETRQVQTLSKADIDAAPPGTSPIKILAKLPSVNFQSADPLGINEYSSNISVRSFGQNQLGYTLDGMPLGDMSYGNFNGLHISRATISENIGGVELAQGAGALDTAASSNLGGTIKFSTVDPGRDAGVLAEAGYGSENTYRLFTRIDTGDLGNGARAYVSGARLDQPKWKGNGKTSSWQANAKAIVPLGEATTITAYAAYSDLATDDYMDMSKSIIDRYGYNWDYLRYDWATAVALAQAYQANPAGDCTTNVYPNGIKCVDDSYYDGTTLRRDYLGYVRLETEITDALTLRIQPYMHHNKGEGTWWYPYSGTPGGAPLFVRSSGYRIQREGLTGSLTYQLGNNELEVGGWYERNKFTYRRFKYGIASDGSNWGEQQWPDSKDVFDRYYDYRYTVNTYQGFAQDTWQVNARLKITAGFKALDVGVSNDVIYSTIAQASGKIKAKDLFLPQAGFNYMIDPKAELFASYSENISAFGSGPFGTDQATFDANKGNIKPESSRTAEGGFRFHLPHFEGLLSGYHVTFRNRLASFSPCAVIETCASITSNVGSVNTNGVELAGTYKLMRHVSLFGSYSFTHARYADDTLNGAGEVVLATDGNTVTGVPTHLANAELAYDNGAVFGRFNLAYQSKRDYTYLNDSSVPGRVLADLTLGFRLEDSSPVGKLEVQANVTNLFDKDYIANVGGTNSDLKGTYQGMMVGAPRQVFVAVRKRF